MQPSQRAKVALLQLLFGGSQLNPALRPPLLGLLHVSTSPRCGHCMGWLFLQFPWCGGSQHVNLVDFSLSEIGGHGCIAAPRSRQIRETVYCVVLLLINLNTVLLLTRHSCARSLSWCELTWSSLHVAYWLGVAVSCLLNSKFGNLSAGVFSPLGVLFCSLNIFV